MKWLENDIRREIERLDQLTGLEGRKVPIVFTHTKRPVACFWRYGQEMAFRFSRLYFGCLDFSDYMAIDTIRHEYAHYMNYVLNGARRDGAHGKMWKECCRVVGAEPSATFTDAQNAVHLEKEREAAKVRSYINTLWVGGKIAHPRGMGRIVALDRDNDRVTLRFGNETKVFSAKWLAEHCQRKEGCA